MMKYHKPIILIEMTSTKNTIVTNEICPTLTSRMGTGGGQVNAVLERYEQVDEETVGDNEPVLCDASIRRVCRRGGGVHQQ